MAHVRVMTLILQVCGLTLNTMSKSILLVKQLEDDVFVYVTLMP